MMHLEDSDQLEDEENEAELLKRINYMKSQENQRNKSSNILLQKKIKEELQAILSIDKELVSSLNNGSLLIHELLRLYNKIYNDDADFSRSSVETLPNSTTKTDSFSLMRKRCAGDEAVSKSKLRFGSYLLEDLDRILQFDANMEHYIQEFISNHLSPTIQEDFVTRCNRGISIEESLSAKDIHEIKRLIKCSELSHQTDLEMDLNIAGVEAQIDWLETNLMLSDQELRSLKNKAENELDGLQQDLNNRLHKMAAISGEVCYSDYLSIVNLVITRELREMESLLDKQKTVISLTVKQRSWCELLIILLKFEEVTHQSIKDHLKSIQSELNLLKEKQEQITALLPANITEDRIRNLSKRNNPLVMACQLIEEVKIPTSLLDDKVANREIQKRIDRLSVIRKQELEEEDNHRKKLEQFCDLVSDLIQDILVPTGNQNSSSCGDRKRILLSSLSTLQQKAQWREKILKCKQDMDLLIEDMRAVNIY